MFTDYTVVPFFCAARYMKLKALNSVVIIRWREDTVVQTQWDWVGEQDDPRHGHIPPPRGRHCWVDAACRLAQEYTVRSPRWRAFSTPTTLNRSITIN